MRIEEKEAKGTKRNHDRRRFRARASSVLGTLVYRLLNPLSFAAGQLAVFQGASEVPLSGS
jgi:hypothetical protein